MVFCLNGKVCTANCFTSLHFIILLLWCWCMIGLLKSTFQEKLNFKLLFFSGAISAAIARAARQRVRARASDQPAGLAVSLLDFTHKRKLSTNHWLSPTVVPPESQAVEIPHPRSSSGYPQLELSTGHFDTVKPSCAPSAEPQPAVPRNDGTASTTRTTSSILRYVPACLAKLNLKP